MRRFFPRDVLLFARLVALGGALAWVGLGGYAVLPVAYVALTFLLLSVTTTWRDDLRRGATRDLSQVPWFVVASDLSAATLWMIATAPNPRSVAFVVVLAVGTFAMYRFGRAGLVATAIAYLVCRVAQEAVRVVLGEPTPIQSVAGEGVLSTLVLFALAGTLAHYRIEQQRGARSLRLARSLERVAHEIAEETSAESLFRSIARSALLLVDAQHATINRRHGEEFFVAAGAGTREGLAAHAAIALRNARLIEQAKRIEETSREMASETGAPADVIRRIATQIAEAYDAEFVTVQMLRGETALDIAGVGVAAPLAGATPQAAGPLVVQLIRRRDIVSMRDYSGETAGDDNGASRFAREAALHAAIGAPVIDEGEVIGAVVVGTTDPNRTFDAIDRQGMLAFAQLAGAALRSARVRDER